MAIAFFLRRADLSFVRIRLPSSAIKKAGKGLPFPACHG